MLKLTFPISIVLFIACGYYDDLKNEQELDGIPQSCELRLDCSHKSRGQDQNSTDLIYKPLARVSEVCLSHLGKPLRRLNYSLEVTAPNNAGRVVQISMGQGRVTNFDREFQLSEGATTAYGLRTLEWVGVLDSFEEIAVVVTIDEPAENIAISDRPTTMVLSIEDQTE